MKLKRIANPLLTLSLAFLLFLAGCGESGQTGSTFSSQHPSFLGGEGDVSNTSSETGSVVKSESETSTSSQNTSAQNVSGSSAGSPGSSSKYSSVSSKTSSPHIASKSAAEARADFSRETSELKVTSATIARSLINRGNLERIANAMRKAKAGQQVTVGVIGGSITYGSSATDLEKTSYAARVAQWWRDTFPGATVKFVNAGIGATDSLIGVHRVQSQLLDCKPDFIIIEFAANDSASELLQETYENLVRRCLKAEGAPGVLLLFMSNQAGTSSQEKQVSVGQHYNLPMISYKDALWPLLQQGTLKWSDLAQDSVHPNNYGHSLAALFIKSFLVSVYEDSDKIGSTVPAVKAPLISDRFEKATLLTPKTLNATKLGSFQVSNNAYWQFKDGWVNTSGTETMDVDITGYKNVFLLYHRGSSSTNGAVKIQVNYGAPKTIDSYYTQLTYAYYSEMISAPKAGKMKISITPLSGERNGFTILGFMVS